MTKPNGVHHLAITTADIKISVLVSRNEGVKALRAPTPADGPNGKGRKGRKGVVIYLSPEAKEQLAQLAHAVGPDLLRATGASWSQHARDLVPPGLHRVAAGDEVEHLAGERQCGAIVLRRDTGGMWAGAGAPKGSCDTRQVLCDSHERALPSWLAFN